MKAIILAAGIGSRLGNSNPKSLTILSSGESILERQINYLSDLIGLDNIIIVVGYKKDIIMEFFPKLSYVYNNYYDTTNTSKSLLKGLNKINNEDVLWLNGDVVFEKELLHDIIKYPQSCMAVNTHSVGKEEIKYNLFSDGSIKKVSKGVKNALGEAVGINKIIASDLLKLTTNLKKCINQDYFEKGLEYSIKDGMKIYPLNINKYLCMEIDFQEDLLNINKKLLK